MNTNLVQRVARAICKSSPCEGVNCCQWPGNMGRTKCPVKDGGYDDAAVAAIEAWHQVDVDEDQFITDGVAVKILPTDDRLGTLWYPGEAP